MRTESSRTLTLWCPDWPVTAAGIQPLLPAAVVRANRVVACSAAARSDGVQPGLRRREAQARCPELVVVGRDPGQEARAFEAVVAAVETFGQRVEVRRPGWCVMATRGPSRYFGGDLALAERVGAAVSGVLDSASADSASADSASGTQAPLAGGLRGDGWRVGIADGPFASRLAAVSSVVVPPGSNAAFLAPLPVATIGKPELVDLLVRLGIRTLGAFAELPEGDVAARFGEEGALAHRLARGLDRRPVAGRAPPPDLAVAMELDPPVDRVDAAAFSARALAEDLHQRLSGRALACTRVGIEIETEHGERVQRLWGYDGAFTPGALVERVRWQLDGWLGGGIGSKERPTAGITWIRLFPDEVMADRGRQGGFWGGEAGVSARAARSMARLQGLLGPEAVVTAVLGGGRGPGERVLLVPWGDPIGSEPREIPPWPGHIPSPAPAVVRPERLAVELLDVSGRPVVVTGRGLASAPPSRLSMEGRPWAEVVSWAGPWPADERWWDPRAHRRRARLQVVVGDGTAHLLSLEAGQWAVEATYG